MKTILITGGIGSGKSEVCRYLSEKGYPVYDCDSACKALYDSVPGLRKRIEDELDVPFSEISVIFSDEKKRSRLENLVYPLLLEDICSWKHSIKDSERCFIESAVALYKPQFDSVYDEVWLVEAPLEERIRRNPKAVQRASLQHFDHSRADRIIINDSTLDQLYKKIV